MTIRSVASKQFLVGLAFTQRNEILRCLLCFMLCVHCRSNFAFTTADIPKAEKIMTSCQQPEAWLLATCESKLRCFRMPIFVDQIPICDVQCAHLGDAKTRRRMLCGTCWYHQRGSSKSDAAVAACLENHGTFIIAYWERATIPEPLTRSDLQGPRPRLRNVRLVRTYLTRIQLSNASALGT